MTLRTSMIELINTLRGFAHAGTDDFTIGSTAYWSDEQLQTVLDRYRTDIRQVQLISYPVKGTDNELEYKEYGTYARFWEGTAGSRFVITDVEGGVISTDDYSVDFENGLITFDEDQSTVIYYLTGHSFDVFGAAADVLEQKAVSSAGKIDFSTDGHTIKRSHIVGQWEALAKKYRSMSISGGSSSADVIRGDYNGA